MDHSKWTAEDYKNAIQSLRRQGKWTKTRAKMLRVQYAAPLHTLIEPELTFLMGWTGHSGNAHYGKLGKLLGAEMLGVGPESLGKGYSVLALDGGWHNSQDERWPGRRFFWMMRPALAQALEELSMVERAIAEPELEPEFGELLPNVDSISYPGGATRQVTVNVYERNPAARKACIRHHGEICKVCGLDMKQFYGSISDGFIHVHHLKPLSEIGAGYTVNPQTDLVPVCPNCHAMLHRLTPPLTVEQLREMIQEAH